MYLLDHTDAEGIDSRSKNQDGFNCRAKFSIEGLSDEAFNKLKTAIENGIIRSQEGADRWLNNHTDRQGRYLSDSIDAEVRSTDENNDGLDSQTLQGESRRGVSAADSQENPGTSFIKVGGADGTNSARYIQINNTTGEEFFTTPQGEVYGFVDKEGNIYLDETVISPEHPIHEYTHLWCTITNQTLPHILIIFSKPSKKMQENSCC